MWRPFVNFYAMLGVTVFVVIILTANNYSPKRKIIILLMGTVIWLLWERPAWLMAFFGW